MTFDPKTGSWKPFPLELPRNPFLHTINRVGTGETVLTGGFTAFVYQFKQYFLPGPYRDAVGYSSDGGTISFGETAEIRFRHAGTTLPSGDLLLTGGENDGGSLASTEVLEVASKRWFNGAPMSTERTAHAAVLLKDGRVLVTGGRLYADGGVTALSSCEVFNPKFGAWRTVGALRTARSQHSALVLPSGKVLVVGGVDSAGGAIASAEVFDPELEQWSETARPWSPRSEPQLFLVGAKDVVLTGTPSKADAGAAELFDPSTGRWRTLAPLPGTTAAVNGAVTADGKLLHLDTANAIHTPYFLE